MAEIITTINDKINNVVWGPIMLVLIVGTGIYLSIRTGFLQASKFGFMWKHTIATVFKKRDKTQEKDSKNVTPFQAVSTALASTVGVGNVAGVAGAIVSGGPGAVFWMWVSAFFGMATKYAEIVLAVKYRQVDKDGTFYGGPMYYIEKGLNMKWLAVIFAFLGGFACLGIGNMTQASEISGALENLVNISPVATGVILMVITAIVIIGGIQRIGQVTSYLVPFMSIFYIIGGCFIIITNITEMPAVFGTIFSSAFSFKAVGGGIFGYAITRAMRYGVARGVFSNEAGLGSAPIAHAAATTKEPVEQGLWGVFEVFVDTIIICTITGVVVVLSGIYDTSSLTGGALTAAAFETLVPFGGAFVRIALILFALSTILGWSYYGERCWGYLSNNNKVVNYIFKIIFVIFLMVGSTGNLTLMWDVADTLNGMMAIPNLIGLLLLSGVTIKLTKEYFKKDKIG